MALAKELVDFERKMMCRSYKFGVLLLKADQHSERDMYGNCEGSAFYEEFLSLLGARVALASHTGYRAGLDCRGTNTTGEYGVYQVCVNVEILLCVFTVGVCLCVRSCLCSDCGFLRVFCDQRCVF